MNFLAFEIFFPATQPVEAAAGCQIWGMDTVCIVFQEAYAKLLDGIVGAINGAAKNAFAQIMTKQIYLQIGGGNGRQPLFIVNFREALVTNPSQLAQQSVNDFLLSQTGGRGSRLNYTPISQAAGGITNRFFSTPPSTDGRDQCLALGSDRFCSAAADCKSSSSTSCSFCCSTRGQSALLDMTSPQYKFEGYAANGTPQYATLKTPNTTGSLATANTTPNAPQVAGVITNGSGTSDITYANTTSGAATAPTNWRAYELPITATDIASITQGATDYLNGQICQVSQNLGQGTALSTLSTATAAGGCNMPIGLGVQAANLYASEEQKNQIAAQTEAIANNGFTGVKDEAGNTKTPGYTIGQILDGINNLPNNLAANAKNISEFAAIAASNMVTATVNNLVNQGINQATTAINNSLSGVSSATGGIINIGTSGGSQPIVNARSIPTSTVLPTNVREATNASNSGTSFQGGTPLW